MLSLCNLHVCVPIGYLSPKYGSVCVIRGKDTNKIIHNFDMKSLMLKSISTYTKRLMLAFCAIQGFWTDPPIPPRPDLPVKRVH